MKKRSRSTTTRTRAAAKTGGRTLKERSRPAARSAAKTRTASTRKKAPKKATRHLKKQARRAMYDFYVVSVVFLVLVMLSSAFLLFQWKNYKIVEFGKEVQQLRAEIYRLNGEIRPRQAFINKELKGPKRIMQVADKKLGLKPSVRGPIIFTVDKTMLEYYAEKDREEK